MASVPSLVVPPLPTTERGHASVLNVDPTGTKWIYPSGNNIVIRGINSAKDTYIYTGHGSQKTTACSFSPNGNWIASADVTGLVKIWGAKGEHTIKAEYRLWAGPVLDLSWSPDSQRIIACGDGKQQQAKAFLFDTGNAVGEIIGHTKRVNSCTFRPVRPFRAATGGEDFLVCFHEGPPFKFSRSMDKHKNFVNSVRFSPDGETLASGGSDSKIHLFEGKTGEYETTFEGTTGSVWGIDWSAKGQLGSVTGDKILRIWEKETSAPLKEYKIGDKLEDMPLGISWATGPLTAVCLDNRLVYVKENENALTTINGSNGPISSVAYSGSGAFFYGSADGFLCRLLCNGDEVPSTRLKIGSRIVQVLASPDGSHPQVAALTADEKIHFLKSNVSTLEVTACHPLGGFAINSSLYKGGESIVVLTRKNAVVALTEQGLAWTRELKRPALCIAAASTIVNNAHLAVAYQGQGNEMTIQTAPRLIEIFDDKGDVLHTIDAHRSDVSCMAFSPNGQYLATCDADRQVIVWKCDDWSRAAKWSFHTSKVTCVSWHADSNQLATGSVDRHVFVWNVATSERDQKQDAHKDGVNGVAWGDKLASVGADGALKLW